MRLARTVRRLGTNTYTITRSVPTTLIVNGRPAAPTVSTLDIEANVQPTSGDDLESVPEAFRSHEMVSIWTTTELLAGRPGSNEGDVITVRGRLFRVIKLHRWDIQGGFYKAQAVLVKN